MSLSDDLELLSKLPSNSPSKMEQRRGEARGGCFTEDCGGKRPDPAMTNTNPTTTPVIKIKDLEDTIRCLRLEIANLEENYQGLEDENEANAGDCIKYMDRITELELARSYWKYVTMRPNTSLLKQRN